MDIAFSKEEDSGLPHCYVQHGVLEEEVITLLARTARRFRNKDGTLVAEGQSSSGRYLRVIYREYPERDLMFVITAYELRGRAKRALRRRRRQ